jgi:hypothetical protein
MNPDEVKPSQKPYDWLGHGFYIWENNYSRALQWAEDKKRRDGTISVPAAVGVVYQLEHCLDFTDTEFIEILPTYYNFFKDEFEISGKELPKNKDSSEDKHQDLVLRELDCAVIEYLHKKMEEEIENDINLKGFSGLKKIDTVRGIFTEGGPAFEGAGIQAKNHIQICIRNFNCIKGFFVPRNEM